MSAVTSGRAAVRSNFDFFKDLRDGLKLWRVWAHLGFREIKLENSNSRLGTIWTMLGLGVLIGAQGLLFSVLLDSDIKTFYPWFASGLIVWILISSVLVSCVTLFRGSREQMLNIDLPYSFYAYRNVATNLTRFAYYLPIYFIVSLISYHTIYPTALLALYGVFVIAVTAVAVAMLLGTVATRYKIFEHIVPTVMPALFLFTPVMWPVDRLGKHLWIAEINPFYHYIALVRDPLMGKALPVHSVLITVVFTALCFVAAYFAYRTWRKTLIFWA